MKKALRTQRRASSRHLNRVNKLGIGAQGLGGLTTVVDVKIKTAPTHAASKPVCLIPNWQRRVTYTSR
ncbi:fumarate hydratase [Vibrio fortis]|uniref:fumarate hydratase n=1 Tax=Vibrio fortis TaxID=212667 RepID=UPI0039951B75